MSGFYLLSDAPTDPPAGPEFEDCACDFTDEPRNVLLSIEGGSISVVCATCRQSPTGMDWELAYLHELPMVMTVRVETYSTADGMEYDTYFDLVPAVEAEAVEEFARVADRLLDTEPRS